MEKVSILKQVELFRGLSQEQLKNISNIIQQEIFNTGDIVCHQGAAADRIYIVSAGQVGIVVSHNGQMGEPLVYLGLGQVIGEMTLVDSGKRSASVIAAENDTILYSIPNQDFLALCEQNTAIGYLIMRNIAQDMSFKLRHYDFEPSSKDQQETDS